MGFFRGALYGLGIMIGVLLVLGLIAWAISLLAL